MSKFVVIVFPDEKKAYAGGRALDELHDEGSLTVYSRAVVARDAQGRIHVKEKQPEGPLGTGVGALVGGIIGMFAGPGGVVLGIAAGSVVGALRDVFNLGVSADFLEAISKELAPGMTAVVAEVSEEWVSPLDLRMEEAGGLVMREYRDDFVERELESAIEQRKAEVAERRAELAAAAAAKKAAIKKSLADTQKKLKAAIENAKARAQDYREETSAKIKALQEQAKRARAQKRARIDARLAEIKADQKRRGAKLEQAWQLTKEALAP